MASNDFPYFLSGATEEHNGLRGNWLCFLSQGATLIAIGLVAIGYPVVATPATVELVGFLLLFGAAVEVASGFWARRWGGFFLHLFGGLLYLSSDRCSSSDRPSGRLATLSCSLCSSSRPV